jgi:hypothetical protein
MAAMRSSTLKKEPRLILLLVNSPNQRSIRVNQLDWLEVVHLESRMSVQH